MRQRRSTLIATGWLAAIVLSARGLGGGGAMRRKALSLVGLAVVLTVAHWFDMNVLPWLHQEVGVTFDPAPAM